MLPLSLVDFERFPPIRGAEMAVDRGRRGGTLGEISLGGIVVIVGIIVAIVWSLWLGIIIAWSGSYRSAGLREEVVLAPSGRGGAASRVSVL